MTSAESYPDLNTAFTVIKTAEDEFPTNPQKQIDAILRFWQQRAQELHLEAGRAPLPENIDEGTHEAEEFRKGEEVRLHAEDALVITLGERIDVLSNQIVEKESATQSEEEMHEKMDDLKTLLLSLTDTKELYEKSGVDTDKIDAEIAEVNEKLLL